MILHTLSAPRVMHPQPGHRAYTAPLAGYRRPPVVEREPRLPLDDRRVTLAHLHLREGEG
jgi:hypothetical protein